jgi:gliding motility-associated-like protein
MKLFLPLILFFSVAFFTSCSTSVEPFVRINCNGLVTDTLGSNDSGRVYIPNAFTPDGDGLNDIFRPITMNIDSIQFTVYDENNAELFTTNILGDGWPAFAPPLPVKRYYYKIQAVTKGNKKIGICGDVYALTCFTVNPSKRFYYFEDMFSGNGFTGTTMEALSNCR